MAVAAAAGLALAFAVSAAAEETIIFFHQDALGSVRLVTGNNGEVLARHDYLPFGEELPADQFGRASSAGYGGTDGVPQRFTGKQRDTETGLDYFGARYHGGSMGRFMTPDTFCRDSHVGDPRSWNEYAYVRDNPLRYTDPNGEAATVSSNCAPGPNGTTCNVNVSASIAIYAAPGSGLTEQQLNSAASTIQSSIQSAWSGSFTQDGVTYNVSTQISVQVAGGEADATKSGAQNVIGLSNGPADPAIRANALTGPGISLGNLLRGQDTGIWNYNTLGASSLNTAAHEFAHLLGIDNHQGAVLSNTNPIGRPTRATASDFGWGIQEVTSGVRRWVNEPEVHYRDMRYGETFAVHKSHTYSGGATVGAPLPWSVGWWK